MTKAKEKVSPIKKAMMDAAANMAVVVGQINLMVAKGKLRLVLIDQWIGLLQETVDTLQAIKTEMSDGQGSAPEAGGDEGGVRDDQEGSDS